MAQTILEALARRARARRLQKGWTIRDIAERSGVSPRFLVQLESGRGNISVKRLADVARALETPLSALFAEDLSATPGVIALLGLRGAGKTTIGRRLARRLRVPFVELDRRIEQAADLSLSELFSLPSCPEVDENKELLIRDLAVVEDPVRTTGDGVWTFKQDGGDVHITFEGRDTQEIEEIGAFESEDPGPRCLVSGDLGVEYLVSIGSGGGRRVYRAFVRPVSGDGLHANKL